MNKVNIFIVTIFTIFFSSMASCTMFVHDFIPYKLDLQLINYEHSGNTQLSEVKCKFTNNRNKEIEEFNIQFVLFDEEGEVLQDNVCFNVKAKVSKNETISFNLSLEEILKHCKRKAKYIDYGFVNKIIYSDNSQWLDPFGIKDALQ